MNWKKFNVTNILLAIGVIILLWNMFDSRGKNIVPQEVIVTIPERTGTTDTIVLERVIETKVPIINTQGVKETIIVDQKYKALYEATKDQLEKERLYLEAIQIREYDSTIVDNKDIKISAFAKTRGSLLDFKVDYKIKKDSITYKPETTKEMPRLSLVLGTEVGVPTGIGSKFNFKGDVGFMNKKGDIFTVGADLEGRLYVGYKKTLKLIK